MAIVFAVRGDSGDARYSNGGKTGVQFDTFPVTVDAGALSGSALVAAANNSPKGWVWPGRYNTPNGRAISILQRIKPAYTGTPAAVRPVMPFLSISGGRLGRIDSSHASGTGNITTTLTNEAGTVVLNAGSHGNWSPTSGTWYDLVFTWDGTTTANAVKFYIDGVLLGAGLTASAAFSASWANTWFSEIALSGNVTSTNHNGSSIDEIVIWDSVIDPTNVTLVSGAGSLNGASRTSLVSVSALDGALWTALAADKIVSGNSQTQAGVVVNGTAVTGSGGGGSRGAVLRNRGRGIIL